MNKKTAVIIAVAMLVVGVAAFYAGISYDQRQVVAARQSRTGQFAGAAFTGGGLRGSRAGVASGGVAAGEIISKDEKSITVKLAGGGSKIVFLGGGTTVSKSVDGTLSDLTVGAQVVVSGGANPDGSMTAKSVQLRPLPINQVKQ